MTGCLWFDPVTWLGRFRRWLRRTITRNLDEDWEQLSAMTDDELRAEWDRLTTDGVATEWYRRCCQVMALRFWKQGLTHRPNAKGQR